MFRGAKTFRPKKNFKEGTLRYELHKKASASLNAGMDLKGCVQLPEGEDLNEWLAMHVVDFFNRINLIYGTVCDDCTDESCPVMSGGPQYEYAWKDDVHYKKPTVVSAPKYITLLMEWIETLINDEKVFPPEAHIPFPKNFHKIVQQIFKRLFRVFVHVYYHHFDRLTTIGAEAHINTCYKHFYYFVRTFDLVPEKELLPLRELTRQLLPKEDAL
ncbi:MOB1 protein [Salpingoeca rosetta]|uniref:MOB1 protein n=1 Tax=Salpingoeca rosetta (strain ATCC 50818 / BSB-021) TaxID=946362 RepID=F2TWP6_SALR5|nr:MOB1 protein [Salpingoeca rosetta]EGD72492.1 MOB1 protein [Salpingoeca rosetta]|eukprot:XP_004999061.1 MOB1 protein [Salpingoeca rosetta]